MRKLELKKIVETMKDVAKMKKVAPKADAPKVAPSAPGVRVRDMRQEAMDQGAHGSQDYFKENQV